MKPGNLVRIIPKDTIGLIVKARKHDAALVSGDFDDGVYTLYHIQLITDTELNGQVRRYLAQDLKLIS